MSAVAGAPTGLELFHGLLSEELAPPPMAKLMGLELTEASEGRYRVTDFAPRFLQYERYYKPLMFIRKIEPLAEADLEYQYMATQGS